MKLFKKNTLEYRFVENEYNEKHVAEALIKEIIVKATPSSSCWWSKLKNRVGESKDRFESKVKLLENTLNNLKTEHESPTAKTCTGILNLFSKTYLLKCPTDLLISVDSSGNCLWEASNAKLISIEIHSNNQYWSEDNNLFENKICIKLEIQMYVSSNNGGYMLTEPYYHNKIDATMPLGYVSALYAKAQNLNVFLFIDLPEASSTKSVVIKKGDVIAYLIPDVKSKLIFGEKTFVENLLVTGFSLKR